jgi:hypothetical protein
MREIYVRPYKNQQIINMKKEEMDGEFVDLYLNSYNAVPSNHCKNSINFWIAKIENILVRDEQNVAEMI